jgi:hypothetical protein
MRGPEERCTGSGVSGRFTRSRLNPSAGSPAGTSWTPAAAPGPVAGSDSAERLRPNASWRAIAETRIQHVRAVQRGSDGQFGIVDRQATRPATSTCLPYFSNCQGAITPLGKRKRMQLCVSSPQMVSLNREREMEQIKYSTALPLDYA